MGIGINEVHDCHLIYDRKGPCLNACCPFNQETNAPEPGTDCPKTHEVKVV